MSNTQWGPPSSSTEAPRAKVEGGPPSGSIPLELTPFQPTGPYPQVMLDLPTGAAIPLSATARGEHIVIQGTLLDGAGQPVADAMIETWQADAAGRYPHPSDPAAAEVDPSFWGYRRVATDDAGQFRIETIRPGTIAGHAPHILIAIYGGGILYRHVTRLYFADDERNTGDPTLQLVPPERRATLLAKPDNGIYRFEIRLQGRGETVFFDV
jgi:protocatechuate 3,4-dioxygenase, alpha subunit